MLVGVNMATAAMCALLKKLLSKNRWPRLLPWLLTMLAFGIFLGPYWMGLGFIGATLVAILFKPWKPS